MSKKILFLSAAMIISLSFFIGANFVLADDVSEVNLTNSDQCGKLIYFCSDNSPYCNLTKPIIDQYGQNSGCVEVSQQVVADFMELVKDPLAVQYNVLAVPTFLFVDKNGCFGDIGKGGATKIEDIKNGIADFKCQSQPAITIISPNGGETYKNDGSLITVKWQTNNVPVSQTFDIIRLRDYSNGREYNLATNLLNDGQEVITISSSIPAGSYTLEIKTYVGDTLVVDSSDSYFKIISDDSINDSLSPITVQEQVKCVFKFKGAASEQKCYTATDDSSPYHDSGCNGTETCLVELRGAKDDKITWKSSCGGYAYSVMDGSSEYAIFYCADSDTITTPAIPQPSSEQIADINEKSKLLIYNNFDFVLAELNELRSIVKEQQTQIKYLNSLLKDVSDLSQKTQDALNNFITYGVDANTEKLGAGERAAVINSYKAAFSKLPETEAELADAIKIANGRWPSITNDAAERKAKEQFQKIYKRIADMNNANDNAAVTVMAYGLRQKAENRNLNSEKHGINTFRRIYGRTPNSTEDWNIMQAITYSGASRGVDSDGDLLIDDREKELGTDPENKDTDGDGYLDGVEVANGYNPLKE